MNEENIPQKPKIELTYRKPYFHRRVFANLIDFIIFVFLFFCLFLGLRFAVTSSSAYQEKETSLLSMMGDSGLYVVSDGYATDIVSYLDDEDNAFSGTQKKTKAVAAIDGFIAYLDEVAEEDASSSVLAAYDAYRLDESLIYEGAMYFVLDDSDIVENEACSANDETYFSEAYAPFIDDYLQGYLVTLVPGYAETVRYESMMLIFAELLPSYVIAGLLVYLVPPLCNPRSHMTLGKMLYHIGLADKRLLSLSAGRFLARFSIFFFGELLLSVVTFGIPFLVSVSIMAFSKDKQGFPDYMLRIYEVDLSHAKLYKSYEEIKLENVTDAKEPVDFRMINRN